MRIRTNVQQGFTIIELMMVVAIIGVLASIAIPNYRDHVKRARVAEATSDLADMRIKMEQYYQDNRTYVGSNTGPCATRTGRFFSISCGNIGLDTYLITATGTGDMSGFSYSVDQANAKNSSYDGVAGNGCWATSKNGC